jgi:hypothetical protein
MTSGQLHSGLRAVQFDIEGREPHPLLDGAWVIVSQCAGRAGSPQDLFAA